MILAMSNKDTINQATGKRVAEVRKHRKLTQKQLATLVGIHPVTLGNYEVGLTSIPSGKKKRWTG